LGVDSIKLMEIYGALGEYHEILSGGEREEAEQLARFTELRTLREIIDCYAANLRSLGRSAESPAASPVRRLVVRPCAANTAPAAEGQSGGSVVLVGEAAGIAESVFRELTQAGRRCVVVRAGRGLRRLDEERYEVDPDDVGQLKKLVARLGGDTTVVVNLLNLDDAPEIGTDVAQASLPALRALRVSQAFEGALANGAAAAGGRMLNVTRIDGACGLRSPALSSLPQVATLGLFKSVAREWRGVRVRSLDLDPALDADAQVAAILQELASDDSLPEVGVSSGGRVAPRLEPGDSLPTAKADWLSGPGTEPVILATGGGDGITAKVLDALVQMSRPRLVIVGRTPPLAADEEPEVVRDKTDVGELRRILAADAPSGSTPVAIEQRLQRLLRQRRLRANLAEWGRAASDVDYRVLDVRDADALSGLIDELYERYGRVDAVIHGAGTIEDCRLGAKTEPSFRRVFDTKVAPALVLAAKLDPETTRLLLLFSSVSARFGNAGQVDYSAANEVLNKLAVHLDAVWKGRAVAINWGPWDTGMPSGPLQELYRRHGVETIPSAAGAEACLREMAPVESCPEIVLASNPAALEAAAGAGGVARLDPRAEVADGADGAAVAGHADAG
jgi:NAD(P)-dependent dehydrogenase (short-subunit alcohol dehydrogenase family)